MNLAITALVFSADAKGTVGFDGTRGTRQKKETFLRALQESAMVKTACVVAGIGRTTAYRWQKEDVQFAEAWMTAYETGTQVLRDEVIRRAFHGTLRPVFQGGKLVGSIRERSDVLLMFELKRRDPTYRERFEVSGPNGGPIQHTHDVHFYIPENGRDVATIENEPAAPGLKAEDRDQAAAGTTGAILSLPG